MWLDWISDPGPLALEPFALPTALRGLATKIVDSIDYEQVGLCYS